MGFSIKFKKRIQKYLKNKGIYTPLEKIDNNTWAFEMYKKLKRKPRKVKINWY